MINQIVYATTTPALTNLLLQLAVGMPVAAAANESFKRARAEGRGDQDFSAVHAVLKQPSK